MVYLYAVTEVPEAPDVPGIRGRAVRAIAGAGLTALASDHEDSRLEPAEDDLWAHEAVVEAAMEAGPVLPMRMGSVVATDAVVVSLLEERSGAFRAALDRVRGAVELGLRIVLREPAAPAARTRAAAGSGPGTAYMLERLGRRERVEELESLARAGLGALAREHTPLTAAPGGESLSGAYLVDSEAVEDFRRRAAELGATLEGAALTCTGPWPPYSFTGERPA